MQTLADQAATGPADGSPALPDEATRDAQTPPGASKTSLAPPHYHQGILTAAEKLEKALAAVIAHNEAQSSREGKWAVTESALARLTGCFRPAVRAFFAQRAAEIEAHNHKHHLVPGLNAARGRRDQQIEEEIRWREREGAGTTEAAGGSAE